MTFSQAVERMTAGVGVTRKAWVTERDGAFIVVYMAQIVDHDMKPTGQYALYQAVLGGAVLPWLPGEAERSADDWQSAIKPGVKF